MRSICQDLRSRKEKEEKKEEINKNTFRCKKFIRITVQYGTESTDRLRLTHRFTPPSDGESSGQTLGSSLLALGGTWKVQSNATIRSLQNSNIEIHLKTPTRSNVQTNLVSHDNALFSQCPRGSWPFDFVVKRLRILRTEIRCETL